MLVAATAVRLKIEAKAAVATFELVFIMFS